MKTFCTEEFKKEFSKLIKKNSYKELEEDIFNCFHNKSIEELKSGYLLNKNQEYPYIKKKLDGRGGYRIYYYLLLKNDNLYLMFVHPKTGSLGYETISDEKRTLIFKNLITDIESNNLYSISFIEESKTLIFTSSIN